MTDETKTCPRCKETKELDEENFAHYKKGWYTYCKTCDRAIGREYYRNNKDKEKKRKKAQSLQYHIENGTNLFKYVEEYGGCADCGVEDLPPYCYDFHHTSDDKKFSISDMMGARPWKTLLKEIEKCIMVCCNCHRIRTAEEMGYYSYLKK